MVEIRFLIRLNHCLVGVEVVVLMGAVGELMGEVEELMVEVEELLLVEQGRLH